MMPLLSIMVHQEVSTTLDAEKHYPVGGLSYVLAAVNAVMLNTVTRDEPKATTGILIKEMRQTENSRL